MWGCLSYKEDRIKLDIIPSRAHPRSEISLQPAVFIDRDGVINRNPPNYVKSWEEFLFIPGVIEAFSQLSLLPWPIVIITNQSVVGRGIIHPDVLEKIHRRMLQEIELVGGRIAGIYVCPHHPDDGCDCRKPNPGLLLRAATDLNLDLHQSVFIGDSLSDILAAIRAGVQPVYKMADGEQIPAENFDQGTRFVRIPAVWDLLEFSKMLDLAAVENKQPKDVIYFLDSGIPLPVE